MRSGNGAGGAWRLVGLLLATVLAVAACGGSSGGGGSGAGGGGDQGGATGGVTELGKTLPQAIQDAGVIKVGSDIAYAPVEFKDETTGEIQGIDPDLGAAMGEKLGVEFRFENQTFDGLIPALQSKRIDIIMSAMSATEERAQTISFVKYFTVGTSILVKKGNPEGIQTLDDLCGKTIALQQGTTQEEVATEQQEKCKTAGQELTVLKFETDPEAQLQVKNGRAVADMNDYPVAEYTAKTAGGGNDFEVVGQQIDAGPYGIGIRKEDAQLRNAIVEALKAIIADGTYDQILQKWNVSQGALKTAEVLGA